MRRLVFYFVFGLFILIAGLFVTRPIFSICNNPFRYQVGSIDPRFQLSRNEFIADVATAGEIWSKAEGKTLFIYDPNATFAINLVFDQRQALNNQVNNLNNAVQSEKNSIDPQIQEYNQKSADFKKRVDALNAQIDYWNNKGGASADEYDKLIAEQQDLKKEAEELNAMAHSLNQSTQQYNTQVGQLNKTIDVYDQTIKVKPEEGLYQPQENKIDIYYNNGHTELIHTLAHELGHALGLNHINNPNAIMYFQTNDQITLSSDDLDALKNICQNRSIYQIVKERIIIAIKMYTVLTSVKN